MTTHSAPKAFDAIIVGGGPNGLTLALALAQIPEFTVLVIDGRDPAVFARSGSDNRGSALTKTTQSMFKALGLWPALQPHLMEMRDIVVTDGQGPLADRPSLLRFSTKENEHAAAAMIENRHLALALVSQVERAPNITLWANGTVQDVMRQPGKISVALQDGRQANAALLVGADGRHSRVRETAGLAVSSHDHGQTALTFTLAHSLPHGSQAQEHFSPTGVCALLPLPGYRSSVVWAENPTRAQQLMEMSTTEFAGALQKHIGEHLGALQVEGKVNAHSLKLHIASALTAPRIALVGDAGHVIHPLAGLGLNLGFKDCAALHECVGDAIARGEDHGSAAVLERYEAWRRFDIVATVAAMEGMNTLFATDQPLIKFLRQFGLKMVDNLPMAKTMIMRQASGVGSAQPRLMRGFSN